jgi:hypothetical protein
MMIEHVSTTKTAKLGVIALRAITRVTSYASSPSNENYSFAITLATTKNNPELRNRKKLIFIMRTLLYSV